MTIVKRKANLIPYLAKDGEIYFYLSHRSKNAKQFPDHWSFWGGKIEDGETPEQAMLREIKEELDYTPNNIPTFCRMLECCKPNDPPKNYHYLGQFYDSMPNEKHIFYTEVGKDFENQIQIKESQGGQFFTLPQIESEPKITEEDKAVIRFLVPQISSDRQKARNGADSHAKNNLQKH
ncbi:MAG: NUDIX domain-containing protein [Candidatus Liptonbacteria bacterium]|nr:NUDIX domain-containing protein [Candidatus Liptonbacteria bacterium]